MRLPEEVSAVLFTDNSNLLVTSKGDPFIRLWPLNSPYASTIDTGDLASITAVTLVAGADELLVAHQNGVLSTWNLRTRTMKQQEKLTEHKVFALSALKSGDVLIAECDDGRCRIWRNLANPSLQCEITLVRFHGSLAISANGELLALADSEGRIGSIWRTETCEKIAKIEGDRSLEMEFSAVFLGRSSLFAAGLNSHKDVGVWNSISGSMEYSMIGGAGRILAMASSPDGDFLLTGHENGDICLWSTTRRKLLTQLTAHKSSVTRVAFSDDGSHFATVGTDIGFDDKPGNSEVKIWQLLMR
jgi:WD40 repeat protein